MPTYTKQSQEAPSMVIRTGVPNGEKVMREVCVQLILPKVTLMGSLSGILEETYRPDRKILGQADIRVEPGDPECSAAQGSIARTAQASNTNAPTLADP